MDTIFTVLFEWPISMWNYIVQFTLSLLQYDLSSTEYSAAYATARAIQGALVTVGISLMVCFWALGVGKALQNQQELRPKFLVTIFARYILANALVVLSPRLFLGLWNIGIGLIKYVLAIDSEVVVPTIDASQVSADLLAEYDVAAISIIKDADLFVSKLMSLIPMLLFALLAAIAIYGMAIYLIIICWSRMAKIIVTIAFAPIGMSFFGGETTSSMGWQYLKGYAGQCLRGVVMAVIILIYIKLIAHNTFITDILNNAIGVDTSMHVLLAGTDTLISFFLEMVLKALVLVGMLKGSDAFIKEQFGL